MIKRTISVILAAATALLAALALVSCGDDYAVITYDGGAVMYSEIEPLLDALTKVEGYKKGSEEYEKFYKEFSENLLYAKLYEAEHDGFVFTYSDEAVKSYMEGQKKLVLENYNMGIREYANSIGMTYSYYKAYVRLSLYKGAVDSLEKAAKAAVEADEELYDEYLRGVYDADPTIYKKLASCTGYLLIVDSRGDKEEEKKPVYDEVAGYIARLEDGEDFFDIMTEVQTKYPEGTLSYFPDGMNIDVIYSKDYSYYTNSMYEIHEMLKTFDEGEYNHTPYELISNDSVEYDENGEPVVVPGTYFGYAVILATDVQKEDRQATFEEAKEEVAKYLDADYLSQMGELYKEKLLAKYKAEKS